MSVTAFRDDYETRHAPLCERYNDGPGRHLRRHLDPQPHPGTGPAGKLPFDVITEAWRDDERAFKGALAHLTTAIMPDEIVADGRELSDRASSHIATVVERESAPANC